MTKQSLERKFKDLVELTNKKEVIKHINMCLVELKSVDEDDDLALYDLEQDLDYVQSLVNNN